MLNVTPEARIELRQLLVRAIDELPRSGSTERPRLGFRLITTTPENAEGSEPGQEGAPAAELGLTLDAPREGDEIVEQDGLAVLLVGGSASQLLRGLTLDVVETPEGARLGLIG